MNGQVNSAFHKIRKQAAEKLAELDFPTPRMEEWRFTNPAPILKQNFFPAANGGQPVQVPVEVSGIVNELNASLVVFVNGKYSKQLSGSREKGFKVGGLVEAIKDEPDVIENHFGRYSQIDNGFNALNTAFASDGAYIYVPKNYVSENPVYLLFIAGGNDELVLSLPRNLIICGESSQVNIIEDYRSASGAVHFTNSVSEIVMGENAVVNYTKIQNENLNSFHISKTQIHQSRNSSFSSHYISQGGAITRNDLNTALNGEGSDCTYYGIYVTQGTQHVDNHTLMDHAKPHCLSNELYKGILSGKSRGVFNGKVLVRKDAQKTNAYQSNKNIILSNEALVNTKPQLEIFADDVRCSHGATVGQLNEEEIFYLRSRGIDDKNARQILIHAFAGDVLETIKPEGLREYINGMISRRLDEINDW